MLETRATKSDGIHGQADVDLLDAGGYVRAPLGKKVSFGVAGRRSYVDQLLPYVLPEPSPGSQRIVVPVYWDAMARLDADLGEHGKLGVFAIRSSDELDVLQTDADDEASLDLNTAVKFFRLHRRHCHKAFTNLFNLVSLKCRSDSDTSGRRAVHLSLGVRHGHSPLPRVVCGRWKCS